MITVEHESSMQTTWEHEMIRDICSWKELAAAAWAAHGRKQPSQRESTEKRNREGGTGERVLQEVGDADGKDEIEVTDRPERMSSACDKFANRCSRSYDEEREGGVSCQRMGGKLHRSTGVQAVLAANT